MSDNGENNSKIVAFLCTWCSYAGADLAGTGRNQYPPNVRVVRIPCSGRINPLYIIKALLEGADGVLVSGCHPGDCHYLIGNYHARRRFVVLKKLLMTAGFDPDRINFTWVSASEGVRFADVIRTVTKRVESAVLREQTIPSCQTQAANASCQTQATNSSCQTQSALIDFFAKQQDELRDICKKLLTDGVVDNIVGFRTGGENGLSLPCIVDSPENTGDLVWNDRCVPNLSGYLIDKKGKTAIITKPCDARAVVSLIKENQLKREDVYIIGLVCGGMTGENLKPLHGCLDCVNRVPPLYDILIGNKEELESLVSLTYVKNTQSPGIIDEMKTQHNDDDFSFQHNADDFSAQRFNDEINKCILCYSCRQSCYGCYCKTCFMERGEPDWLTASPDKETKMLYHLGRAMHLSGRCIGCGACENACASGVDIRYLIKEVTRFIDETYGYQAGMDLETEPAMLTYKADDPEIGFLKNIGGDAND